MRAPSVRLYRFYNFALSRYGEPFALCDEHAAADEREPPPAVKDGNIFRRKIADKALQPCNRCEAEAPARGLTFESILLDGRNLRREEGKK